MLPPFFILQLNNRRSAAAHEAVNPKTVVTFFTQRAKRSFRAAGKVFAEKLCFCNDENFFGGEGYYIFAKRTDYIYKEYYCLVSF